MTRTELAELEQQPRPERLRRLWEELSPAGQAECWDAIGDNGRVDLISACFYAREEDRGTSNPDVA